LVSVLLSSIASFFAILSAVLLLFMFAYLLKTERKAPHITAYLGKTKKKKEITRPLVSVIIAARNEEEKISRCIGSLLEQRYANLEILVVDDNSSDRTRLIAKEFERKDKRVRVISSGPKPEGWVGKSWPCEIGSRDSKGGLLLFVDADSVFDPLSVEHSVSYLEDSNVDIFSISPNVNLKGIWSRATLPLVSAGINLLYPMEKVNDQKSKRAYVFGTFILIKRTVYESIGGHRAIRDRIVEDAALAQLAKSNGYKLQVMIGDGLISTDWESEFQSIYHGMERIFSDSIRSYGLLSILNAVLMFILGLYPIAFIIGFGMYLFLLHNFLFAPTIIAMILDIGLFASILSIVLAILLDANEIRILKRKRKIDFAPLLYPLGFFLFISAIITSTMKVSRAKGIEWKGQKFEQKLVLKT
jgi:chlorobactene glucosyltransferase